MPETGKEPPATGGTSIGTSGTIVGTEQPTTPMHNTRNLQDIPPDGQKSTGLSDQQLKSDESDRTAPASPPSAARPDSRNSHAPFAPGARRGTDTQPFGTGNPSAGTDDRSTDTSYRR